VDGYMNIALEKTEEYVNGVKRRTYGDAFVRGNNGPSLFSSCLCRISPDPSVQSCTSLPIETQFYNQQTEIPKHIGAGVDLVARLSPAEAKTSGCGGLEARGPCLAVPRSGRYRRESRRLVE
jgi:hypothetical protein